MTFFSLMIVFAAIALFLLIVAGGVATALILSSKSKV